MASVLLRNIVDQKQEAGVWEIGSAGTWARGGDSFPEKSRIVLDEIGIKAGEHNSRRVTRDLLKQYALILTMEKSHKEALIAEFHEFSERIFLLSEMVGDAMDIKDPVMGTVDDYRTTAQELQRILLDGYEKIRLLARD